MESERKDPMDWLVGCSNKKYHGRTYRDVMSTNEGREYLLWWRNLPIIEKPGMTGDQIDQNFWFKTKHINNIDACFEIHNQKK